MISKRTTIYLSKIYDQKKGNETDFLKSGRVSKVFLEAHGVTGGIYHGKSPQKR